MSGPPEDRDGRRDADRDARQRREREIDELLSGRGGAADPPPDTGEPPARPPAKGGDDAGQRPDPPATRQSRGTRTPRPQVEEEKDGTGIKLPFNYGALVGLLFALIVLIAVVNLLTSQESGTVGIGDVGIGEKVAPFAVPIATSQLEGDANIDPDEACEVPGKDVLRICDYFDRPTVISFWFTTGASACIDQQDVFETVAERFGDRVAMISINVRDDRERVREIIEQRGWDVTVGHDTDGAVSNIYRVGGCPTFLFVAPGGVLERAEIGRTTVEELSAQVRSFADGE